MKKRWMVLMTGMLMTTVCAGAVHAKTWAIDSGDGTETKIITITEAKDGSVEESYSEQTASKDAINWHKQSIKEEIAPLEAYGVSYDAEKDVLYYQGQTVRLLIDEQIGDTWETLQMSEGEIDLYTVRAEDFHLTGVRVATQEEYDANSKEIVTVNERSMVYYIAEDSAVTVTEGEADNAVEIVDAVVLESTTTCESDYIVTDNPLAKEYEEAGIISDDQGGWLWKGEKIDWLIDENGGIHMNNTEKDKKDRRYVLVLRDDEGSIEGVKEVSIEEAVQKYAESH